jgi:hypothetical protein
MARLIIDAIVTNGVVEPGTVDPVSVTASVTRADGSPVSSLTAADFTVGNTWGPHRLIVTGFQGGNVQIGPGATNAGGLYMFQLIPVLGATWVAWSTYHVVIVVASGSNHGQAIAALTFPAP